MMPKANDVYLMIDEADFLANPHTVILGVNTDGSLLVTDKHNSTLSVI